MACLLRERFQFAPSDFSVHRRRDDEFLLRFRDAASRALVSARLIRAARFRLLIHPWSRLAGAEPVSLRVSIDIEITGIRSEELPPDPWSRGFSVRGY